ncbi:unnamed protein product [Orchesella dallaii]|uniref:Gamma-glutamylcyclotransferase n=1 Tax=Orchesella dallaii TaxID=48710 RepID=A0ABP1R1D7_9HEXA
MYLKLLLSVCFVGGPLQIYAHSICHPQPNENRPNYIVGYGSLINLVSKNKTYPDTGVNIPVNVTGFRRTWTARGYSNFSLSTTYLGVEELPDSYINGVIFSVPNAGAIQKYDERERYYCRVKVPYEHIKILRGKISDNGAFPTDDELKGSDFWIYVTIKRFSEYPNEQYPIVQSYVDIFIGGCLQMERKYGLEDYADDCVTHTTGWEYPWVNDRLHPRRPFAYQSEAGGIDRVLGKYLPDHKTRTYIERIYYLRSSGSLFNIVPSLIATSGLVSACIIGNI